MWLNFKALLTIGLLSLLPTLANAERVVNVYNWSDYITEETLKNFEQASGIHVVYDVYDSNEILEAKLLAGKTGYDVVFPSAHPFAQRQISAGLLTKLDKSKLSGHANLDAALMKTLSHIDPGNAYLVPYMWGTTGLGFNIEKVKALLGDNTPLDSWAVLFDENNAKKLSACGISMLDDEQEVFAAALIYLGKDPNTTDKNTLDEAAALLRRIQPYIKYFHNSKYISDLANGDLCLVHGYSGDIFQARDRAEEAKNNIAITYIIPREGSLIWTDVMAIPLDAPHPVEALAFIDYLLKPEVIASISNFVAYANANSKATALLDEEIRTNPGIYPPPNVQARLVAPAALPKDTQRYKTRSWTRVKTGK